MAKGTCSVEGCDGERYCRGWCASHYQRWKLAGDPLIGGPLIRRGRRAVCSVEGCTDLVDAWGLCNGHYSRAKKHGDPLGGGTPRGEPMRWLAEFVTHCAANPTNDCLTDWPFSRDTYPEVRYEGRLRTAHQLVLEMTARPKPFSSAEVRHLCGNGHLGCLNPFHLQWGTRHENMADMVAHGRSNQGQKAHCAVLTPDAVRAIRASTESRRTLAKLFGVSSGAIDNVIRRRTWAWLD